MDFKYMCRALRLQNLLFVPVIFSFKVAILTIGLVYESNSILIEIYMNVLTAALAFYGIVYVGLLCHAEMIFFLNKLI